MFIYGILFGMAKNTKTKAKATGRKRATLENTDGIYFLKLVMYLILGSFWIKITDGSTVQIPIPIGLVLGLVFAAHDKVQLDRKIGFAILLVAMLVGFWAPFGVYVAI